MPISPNVALIIAASLSGMAALLHVGVIVGGAAWYRFFGAGEGMASAAAAGRWYPALITAGITAVLALWAAYALAGAGIIRPLPWLKAGLCAITAVYLLRGLVLVPVLLLPRSDGTDFGIWSSAICLGFGAVHLLGLSQVWGRL